MRGNKGSAIVAALALGSGLVSVLACGAGAATHDAPRRDWVYFREALCYAPAYKNSSSPDTLPSPPCSPSSTLNLQDLQTTPDTLYGVGFKTGDVRPDQALATVRSTPAARDRANATVLLPGLPGSGPEPNSRFVLGPAEMTSRSIANARATKLRSGAWVVDYSTTPDGAALWDRVANENFHLVLAIDLDGEVVSAPIIEPVQSTFSSFNGRGEISGNLTRSQAMRLAHAL